MSVLVIGDPHFQLSNLEEVRTFIDKLDTYLSEQKLTKLSKTNPNMKVYILHGTNDTIVPASMGRKLAKAHPKSHYQELPKTGHQLPFEAENKVKDIIINTSSSS